jgi:two-component system, chemotaxis family, CheB/CheR fusion protein
MATEETDPAFEELLLYLKRTRGFDFTGYKRTSLKRRIDKRMEVAGAATCADYTDYLEVHPDEFVHLFNTILINVTGFFRDPAAWEYVAAEVVPRILANKNAGETIRVWSAGCASGEEAYTAAIVLAEALGPDGFRDRVKIYGTDVDMEALNQARLGSYSARDVEDVPKDLLEKYFEKNADRYNFRKDLRRSVIFGRHDLMQDAPISRLDLLICRNTLMYFNAETQLRILDRFHFALAEGGYLFLGKAEMLMAHNSAFAPVDLKRRVFMKPAGPTRGRFWPPVRAASEFPTTPLVNHVRVREAAFDTGPVPQVIIDAQGLLALANQQARAMFGLTGRDLGQPFQDLEVSFRPVELRPHLEQAISQNRSVLVKEVEWRKTANESEYLDVQIVPLRDNGNQLGTSITFTNVTQSRRLQEDLQKANHELESAYEELQSTNEELETTNEELQSTVEELETTNEELQSTNEELETMNEELQSANEELQTINEELRERSEELNQVNTFLQSILSSLKGAVAVLDRDLMVMVWNNHAEEVWGLRSAEVQGKQFLNLDIGLPVVELRPVIREALSGDGTGRDGRHMITVNAINRRGKAIQCRITATPLAGGTNGEPRGVILLMEDKEKEA